MNLQDLEIYRNLYELGSINLVARTLGFAQSNITARLQVLENEFDVQLFNRSYKGIVPTKAGVKFYRCSVKVLAMTRTLRQELLPKQVPAKVVISELLFDYLIIQQKMIDINQTTVQVMSSSNMMTLKSDDVDEVITYANFNNQTFDELALAYLDSHFYGQETVVAEDLPLFVNRDSHCPFRARTLRFGHQRHHKIIEIDSWDNIINLVKQKAGIALLPDYIGQREGLKKVYAQHQFSIPYKTFRRRP